MAKCKYICTKNAKKFAWKVSQSLKIRAFGDCNKRIRMKFVFVHKNYGINAKVIVCYIQKGLVRCIQYSTLNVAQALLYI